MAFWNRGSEGVRPMLNAWEHDRQAQRLGCSVQADNHGKEADWRYAPCRASWTAVPSTERSPEPFCLAVRRNRSISPGRKHGRDS